MVYSIHKCCSVITTVEKKVSEITSFTLEMSFVEVRSVDVEWLALMGNDLDVGTECRRVPLKL